MFKAAYLALIIRNKTLLVNHNPWSNVILMTLLCIINDSIPQNVARRESVNVNTIREHVCWVFYKATIETNVFQSFVILKVLIPPVKKTATHVLVIFWNLLNLLQKNLEEYIIHSYPIHYCLYD